MARGCALIDSRLDTAKIGSDGRVEVHRARLLAVFGGTKNVSTRPGSKAPILEVGWSLPVRLQLRTFSTPVGMSQTCHFRTHAPQQNEPGQASAEFVPCFPLIFVFQHPPRQIPT